MAERHLTYFIGEPGAGKSSLVEYCTADQPYEETDSPFSFRRYDCGVVELGKRREGGYSGTDALAMNVQPKVEAFLAGVGPRMVLAEGDRLANDKFLAAAEGLGYQLHLYELWGPRVAAAQRQARGSNQNPNWLRGRQTKCVRLRHRWNHVMVVLPAGQPLAELEARLEDPVMLALRAAREAEVR